MSSLDYLNLCRLCLVKDRVSAPIFEDDGDVRQIFLKITACLPVKVTREDKLPKKICDECVYKVELCYQFWNTTANAEKQLMQWLGEVNMEDKQDYVLNPNGMKPGQSNENRLDGTVMQQVSEHQNNMNMGMMDNINLGMPMMMSSTQQVTSVPMDTSNSSVQNVQAIAGPSTQATHDQIVQSQTDASAHQEEEEESSEEEENTDDECDGDEGLPIKEEGEEDPNSNRTIEPTTFVNVSLACDEAGPSGLQQQKIADIPEMVMSQAADVDPKTGFPELLEIDGLKIEAIRESRAFFLDTSSSTADISSTESSKENRGGVRSVRVRYTCNVCAFPCRTRAAFRKHMQLHKNTCKVCNELFESSDKLERHMVIHHGEPKYSCQLCYYVTWNLPDMKDHFVVRHLDPFCNSCSICNRTFPTKYAIERHMCKQHSNLSVACTICKRIFNNLTKLKTHTRFVHLKSGYQCELCKHRLSTLASLETHIRRHKAKQITPNLDTYICTTCGETFFNKPTLNKHMAVHGKINPYICPVCQKAFEKRSNQVQHILTHMTNVYECDICGVKFSRRAHLIIHRKTHPGPLGPLPIIPVIGIVSEFVKDYINKNKNLQNIE